MRSYFLILLSFVFCAASFEASAQRLKMAVFAPLYLDSAFTDNGDYKFAKTFPKFLNPGLEFYQGVQQALDSLQQRGAPLEVYIYDSKAKGSSIAQQMRSPEMADVGLVLAQSSLPETRELAEIAKRKKIPFVSATLPNDAGVENNPYFVVLNTTLQGHIEGIYRMLQKNFSADNLVLFRKSGPQEDAIKSNFLEMGKSTPSVPLRIKMVDVGSTINYQTLAANLDSTKRNVVIAGSLEESFGRELAKHLSSLSATYQITLIGMPTWDNFNFGRTEYKGLDIIYTTPFFYNRLTPLESRLGNAFEKEIGSRPTDNFFRGYEVALRFALLLLETKNDVISNLTLKGNNIFTRFDIQPVFKDKKTMTLDFLENKNLNFVRVNNGVKRLM